MKVQTRVSTQSCDSSSSLSPLQFDTSHTFSSSSSSAAAASAVAAAASLHSLSSTDWFWTGVYHGNETKFDFLSKRWTSQVGQDKTIVEIFNGKRGGYFLDLASNDAWHFSNTLTLDQEYEWNGICVEANPQYAPGYHGRRCLLIQAAVGPLDNEIVRFVFEEETGGIQGFDHPVATNKGVALFTISVDKLLTDLNAPTTIDYLSLDIEGAEWWTFSTFPWHKYTFLTLRIERAPSALREKLFEEGYIFLCNHGSFDDQLFIHTSLPDIDRVIKQFSGRTDCRTEEIV